MRPFVIMLHQKNICFVFSSANSCACKLAATTQFLRVLSIKPLVDVLLIFC